MSGQKQDLIVYNDNSIISDKVLLSPNNYLSIISHVQGTNPSWLLNSMIENATMGTATQVASESGMKRKRSDVIFISFLHSADFYYKNCKKNGLDLATMENFTYIDCFTTLFTELIKDAKNAATDIEKIFSSISEKVTSIAGSKKIIFIEYPEFLVQATNLQPNVLLKHILLLNKLGKHLYVISNQDYPLTVDLSLSDSSHPTFKLTDFLVKLYHRSHLNINLKPLETGRAKDITGCLCITHGCLPYMDNLQVREQEYIFNLTKDSNVSLYFR